VLKQRKVQPRRVRQGDDDNDDDSEDECEREKAREREAATLSPELMRLVDAVQVCNTARVRVVPFLHASQAHAELVSTLQPRIIGVRGHALTFYREAVRAVCRLHHLPFIDLRDLSIDLSLTKLREGLAACTSGVAVVDGFPCASAEAPYAAQQLLALEKDRMATMPLFICFRASLDVLLEKYPTLGRNALEDAQDRNEDAQVQDVDSAFAMRRLRDVSCERELQDAQDAFASVLVSAGLVGAALG
jgi:hypothetical protein